jgi:hypothetical protein
MRLVFRRTAYHILYVWQLKLGQLCPDRVKALLKLDFDLLSVFAVSKSVDVQPNANT